jgi:hypothetical protein
LNNQQSESANSKAFKEDFQKLLEQFDGDIETCARHFAGVSRSERSPSYGTLGEDTPTYYGTDRSWVQIQQDWEDIRKAESILKKELEEDDWLVVVRS